MGPLTKRWLPRIGRLITLRLVHIIGDLCHTVSLCFLEKRLRTYSNQLWVREIIGKGLTFSCRPGVGSRLPGIGEGHNMVDVLRQMC